MNKEQYIKELRALLQGLPDVEIDSAIIYCQEYFDEVGDVDIVLKELGSPREFADGIIGTSINKAVIRNTSRSNNNSRIRNFWLIILGILSLPISLPLIILLIVLFFTIIIVLLSMLLLSVAGIITSISLFVVTLFSFTFDVQASLLLLTISLTAFGASLVLVSVIVQGAQKFISWLSKKISNALNRKEEQNEEVN